MAEAEQAHADDPERAELLRRARRFKTSWIELAEALTQSRRGGRWREWGYASFEAYAKSELHLRQETVDKLTGSYSFLQRRAPTARLHRAGALYLDRFAALTLVLPRLPLLKPLLNTSTMPC